MKTRRAVLWAGKSRMLTRRGRRRTEWARFIEMRKIYQYWAARGVRWHMTASEFAVKKSKIEVTR